MRAAGFEILPDTPPQSLLRRLLAVHWHLFGLLSGGVVSHTRRGLKEGKGRGFRLLFILERLIAWLVWPFLDRTPPHPPFPVQLRRRLEILGPTYIKLGQILALREDILPAHHRGAQEPPRPPAGRPLRPLPGADRGRTSSGRIGGCTRWIDPSRSARPRSRRSTAPDAATARR